MTKALTCKDCIHLHARTNRTTICTLNSWMVDMMTHSCDKLQTKKVMTTEDYDNKLVSLEAKLTRLTLEYKSAKKKINSEIDNTIVEMNKIYKPETHE
ncbi:hypothetical protein Molly5_143 [Maribacter phage Molly_5]|nr:hypothetical protein Molly4_143 [Maribacter phage Molly_4]QQO98237.1 hypothetical protein Molly5_143 [Maribacter phage Molly_5]